MHLIGTIHKRRRHFVQIFWQPPTPCRHFLTTFIHQQITREFWPLPLSKLPTSFMNGPSAFDVIRHFSNLPAQISMLLDYAPTNAFCKVIHPKYYEHLKKGAHQSHLGRKKWAGLWQISLYIKLNWNIM